MVDLSRLHRPNPIHKGLADPTKTRMLCLLRAPCFIAWPESKVTIVCSWKHLPVRADLQGQNGICVDDSCSENDYNGHLEPAPSSSSKPFEACRAYLLRSRRQALRVWRAPRVHHGPSLAVSCLVTVFSSENVWLHLSLQALHCPPGSFTVGLCHTLVSSSLS